ncbi:mitochondrial fission ELM1 family protein [Polymorphum gilvum]|uniref:Nucleoside-diphosphate sugar epimerase n=1 Tax=Polymorphum gilvum (strain LMG 25793 / CGMCC 1.9160 / SL003B-26A1) TaxID=991905 RepID=F2J0L7_POLGS|nr:mitochondrial fission ELM1 family protein [Polymorphum gilvum]ADZ69685.1 hypothetical protein SL003B_1256 [Polymorphum gilvum SL003B-26A1]
MIQKDPETPATERPRTVWVLTDGKAGDEAQCIGVAEALEAPFECRRVAPRAPFVWLMPWGPIDPAESEDRPESPLKPPYPDLAIASGRRAVPYLRRLKRLSGGKTFTVFLKDPLTGPGTADLIWVPEHDRLRGANVLVAVTGPHRFSAAAFAAARATVHPQIDALRSPRLAVLVGGNSRHHRFTPDDIARFAVGLERLAADGAALMITTSRRTPATLLDRLRDLARTGGHYLWTGDGDNPLVAMLAKADAVVATADSTNMIGEAAATGKPVHVFRPNGGHRKIDRFLGNLDRLGIIHPFPGPLKTTTYEPLNSTPLIAEAILSAFANARRRSG